MHIVLRVILISYEVLGSIRSSYPYLILFVILVSVAARLFLRLVPVGPHEDALRDPMVLPPIGVQRAALHVAGTRADHEAAILQSC